MENKNNLIMTLSIIKSISNVLIIIICAWVSYKLNNLWAMWFAVFCCSWNIELKFGEKEDDQL